MKLGFRPSEPLSGAGYLPSAKDALSMTAHGSIRTLGGKHRCSLRSKPMASFTVRLVAMVASGPSAADVLALRDWL